MAIYEVAAPNGDILEIEGPDDASEADIIAAAQRLATEQPVEKQTQPPAEQAVTPELSLGERLRGMLTQPIEEQGTTPLGLMGAAARGMAPIATGAALGAALGAPTIVGAAPGAVGGAAIAGGLQLIVDPAVDLVNRTLGTTYQRPTEALEGLLTSIGVAKALSPTERVVQAGAAGLGGAAGSIAQGEMLAKLATSPQAKAVAQQLMAQPVQQLAGGLGAGIGGQSAAESGAGPAGQIAGALAGGVAGARMARTAVPQKPVQLPSDLKDAEKAGIRVLTTDVVPPRTFASKWLQATGEKIPLAGTGSTREAQQAERIASVKNVLMDFGVDQADDLPQQIVTDLAAKRSADLKKYTGLKTDVISRLSEKGAVPMNRTISAIDEQVNKLKGLKTAELAPAISKLEDWKAAIQGQDLENIELLRKQLGESFTAPELANIRKTTEKSLSSIYGKVVDDMREFIQANGERRDYDKWNIANKRLSEMAGELKRTSLKSVLNRGEGTPELVNNMLFSAKPSEVRALYSQLTPAGRAKAQTAILAQAAEKANGIENISPDRFANEVNRLGKSVGVFFSDEDLQRVKGLSRALELTKRASQAAVAPPTGVQVALPVGAAVLTDLFGSWGAATISGATLGGLARAYESKPVRDFLLRLPQTKLGSQEEAALVKRLAAVAQSQQQRQNEQSQESK